MIAEALRSFKSKMHTILNSSDRRAKIQDSDFIIGLLQAVAKAKSNFTLSELQQSICMFLEVKIGRSAFNERLGTASLIKGLYLTLSALIAEVAGRDKSTTDLYKKIGVSGIIGIDASMVSLWDGLCEHFKGTFMHAAVKLHLSIDLVSGAVKWFAITAGAVHDSRCFPIPLSRALYIFDLGYWSNKLMQQISSKDAFFLSRVKSNATLVVKEVIYGMGLSVIGHDIITFPFQRKRKSIVELIASMSINGVDVPFRVLGFWNKKDHSYRWYITNLKCSRHLVYDLYRLRWQLELSFKSMKSTLNFDRMPTLNPNTIFAFTLVALINYILAMIIREEAKAQMIKQNHTASTSILRAAKVYSAGADALLDLVKLGRRITAYAIARLIKKLLPLLSEVFDPNWNRRKTSLGILQDA